MSGSARSTARCTVNILDKLILQGEGPQLDFKKTITHPEKIARTIVSFANHLGGQLLVGVMDDGYVTGIDAEEEKYMLQQASQFYCEPPIKLRFKEIDDEGKTVLLVNVPESRHKPHYAKTGDNEWKAYIRVEDESVLASKLVEKTLRNEPAQKVERHLSNIEKALLDYLALHKRINTRQFCKLVNISDRRASRILIALTLDGVIRLHDKDKENYYTLS